MTGVWSRELVERTVQRMGEVSELIAEREGCEISPISHVMALVRRGESNATVEAEARWKGVEELQQLLNRARADALATLSPMRLEVGEEEGERLQQDAVLILLFRHDLPGIGWLIEVEVGGRWIEIAEGWWEETSAVSKG